jgi:hypothetical protein
MIQGTFVYMLTPGRDWLTTEMLNNIKRIDSVYQMSHFQNGLQKNPEIDNSAYPGSLGFYEEGSWP